MGILSREYYLFTAKTKLPLALQQQQAEQVNTLPPSGKVIQSC